LIYKFESFELFKTVLDKMNTETVSFLAHCKLPIFDQAQSIRRGPIQRKDDLSNVQTSKSEASSYSSGNEGGMHDTRPQVKAQPVRVEKEVGRNEPCPCGSGKKFKNCHGKV
jgi:preprotein translocase subunit SecA